jgi:ABC-type glycerol-3-phosphate transport system permease component
MMVANHCVLIAVSCAFLFPVVYMFFTALQSNDQALTGSLWPFTVAGSSGSWRNTLREADGSAKLQAAVGKRRRGTP